MYNLGLLILCISFSSILLHHQKRIILVTPCWVFRSMKWDNACKIFRVSLMLLFILRVIEDDWLHLKFLNLQIASFFLGCFNYPFPWSHPRLLVLSSDCILWLTGPLKIFWWEDATLRNSYFLGLIFFFFKYSSRLQCIDRIENHCPRLYRHDV